MNGAQATQMTGICGMGILLLISGNTSDSNMWYGNYECASQVTGICGMEITSVHLDSRRGIG